MYHYLNRCILQLPRRPML